MQIREPINALTHLSGIVLSIAGMIALLALNHHPLALAGSIVFGLSMVLLYTASTVYHWYSGNGDVIKRLRKFDHAMIFVLIAGTYTPICLLVLGGRLGIGLLITIWAIAIAGIVAKIKFINMPRALSAAIYLVMGWLCIFFIYPIYKGMPAGAFPWLVAGGILYTIGSLFYASKSDRIKIGKFGFHEIFHLFILAGSAAHYIMIVKFLI
ncbi:MAG: hemolysin [Clostridiales bacterium]|jgi:hemolysin III|nr:hemolysin [Clostridiales bacterium]